MDESAGGRAYAMWDHLMLAVAAGQHDLADISTSGERGIVTRQDAAEALLYAAAGIIEIIDGGVGRDFRLMRALAGLMAARDFILPLPSPPGDESQLRSDLQQIVDDLRALRNEQGVPDWD